MAKSDQDWEDLLWKLFLLRASAKDDSERERIDQLAEKVRSARATYARIREARAAAAVD